MKKQLPTLALLGATFVLIGCDNRGGGGGGGPQPPVGGAVTVQFRRDYLGGAKDGPASATAGSINDNQVALQGKLVRVTGEWVVIENQGREQWVPRAAVLYIDAVKPQ